MIQATEIKMLVNLNRGMFIPLVGENAEPANVHKFLKDKNARIGFDTVKNLMEGREVSYKDFQIGTMQSDKGFHIPEPHTAAQKAPVAAAVRKAPVPTGPQPATLKSAGPQVARGRGREYQPAGDVKALKRGTVYADLMELMLKGATMKEMLAKTTNATAGGVNDVLSWQIKNRGYGLRFERETGKYFLVLPQGHTGLTYKD